MIIETNSGQTAARAHQRSVENYFRSHSGYWEEIYQLDTLYARIHQERQSVVLALVDKLHLPREARILDVGCGAGVISAELSERGYNVHAIDSVPEMLARTWQRSVDRGLSGNIRITQANVAHLPFQDRHFSMVLAIGVLPWIESLRRAVEELVRVTKMDGYLILNTDNPWRLQELLDPRLHPLHAGLRSRLRALTRAGELPRAHRCSRRALDRLVQSLGCVKLEAKTLGFGPFSFLGRRLFPEQVDLKLHRVLQNCSDRGVPVIRATGAQCIVLLQKTRGAGRD